MEEDEEKSPNIKRIFYVIGKQGRIEGSESLKMRGYYAWYSHTSMWSDAPVGYALIFP